jgi:ABC-type enterochelin transport system ATPase subunit
MVEIRNLEFSYGSFKVLDNVSLTLADGKIYVLTANNGVVRNKGWKLLISTWTRMKRTDNEKKWGTFYIAEREVKAGEVVELPKAKKYQYGALLLAKTIEY